METRKPLRQFYVLIAGHLSIQSIIAITLFNYTYKFIIAVLITPIIYAAHWVMDLYPGREVAETLIRQAERDEPMKIGAGS